MKKKINYGQLYELAVTKFGDQAANHLIAQLESYVLYANIIHNASLPAKSRFIAAMKEVARLDRVA